MSYDLSYYSPEDVTVSIAGVVDLEGFYEGTFINIQKDDPLFSSRTTADGMTTRTKRSADVYTIRLSLMNTSSSNELLSKLSLLDQSTFILKFPLMIKDTVGSTLFFASSAWVEQYPETSFGTDISQRDWVIKAAQATLYVGGNTDASSMMEDLINTIGGLAPSIRGIV